MRKISRLVGLLFLGVTLAAAAVAGFQPTRLIIYNDTPSLPQGFYRVHEVRDVQSLAHDELVLYPIPASVRQLVKQREYLPMTMPLLKPVTAMAGDYVCTAGRQVMVREQMLGAVRERDSLDRPLPFHEVCERVPDGQIYSFSPHTESFDSRHYGPIATSDILARATPLWTWDSASGKP